MLKILLLLHLFGAFIMTIEKKPNNYHMSCATVTDIATELVLQ